MLLTCVLAAPAAAQQMRILIQTSPLAGFQYYGGKILWDDMREGDRLALVREPDNRHDPFAVRVEWRGTKLGYLPRSDNRDVAEEMDRGTPIAGRIGRLTTDRNPWKRVRVDVYVGL
ncbi:HIRAN domain-containing protein [Thauera aminoaromatica]|uniref:HIRAN domain-containing protein n=1 Tax=Thauera aminoaromatica TaxID=164330 RepID=UPI0023F334CC|nr:HIRAN domain-containing protein [Thauera aminoaromatica]